jgi:hypothetical protein
MVTESRLIRGMNAAYVNIYPRSNAVIVLPDYKLDVRFRSMLEKYHIPLSSRDPYAVMQGIVGKRCVSMEEGHIQLPSVHALTGMAAIDLVDQAIASLELGERMPRSEERMLQLVKAVFDRLPGRPDPVKEATLVSIKDLVSSAAI